MKIAMTVWGARISPVFDAARMLLIAEIENDGVVSRRLEPFNPSAVSRLAQRLKELKVSTLICGAISRLPALVLETEGIELIPFLAGNVEQMLASCSRGAPINPAFVMPGCRHMHRGGRWMGMKCPVNSFQGREVKRMPRGDKTGPQGKGPGTGRKQGGCQSGQGMGKSGRRGGQGKGRGRGAGQGSGQGSGGRSQNP